jgi:hypothetical protein
MPHSGGILRSSSPTSSPKHVDKVATVQAGLELPMTAVSAASLEMPSSVSDAVQSEDSTYNSSTMKRRKALTPSPEQVCEALAT